MYTKYATIIKTMLNIKDVRKSLFSIIFFMVGPNLAINKAIIKNLDPLVNIDTIIK